MTSFVMESPTMAMRDDIWGSGIRFAHWGRLLQDSEVELDSYFVSLVDVIRKTALFKELPGLVQEIVAHPGAKICEIYYWVRHIMDSLLFRSRDREKEKLRFR